MKNSNLSQAQNHNQNTRKKNDPRYERVVVGYRMVAMQAKHVDDSPRCFKCFLKNARAGHFCRWNIENEGPRDPNPPMRQVPIYEYRLRGR